LRTRSNQDEDILKVVEGVVHRCGDLHDTKNVEYRMIVATDVLKNWKFTPLGGSERISLAFGFEVSHVVCMRPRQYGSTGCGGSNPDEGIFVSLWRVLWWVDV